MLFSCKIVDVSRYMLRDRYQLVENNKNTEIFKEDTSNCFNWNDLG